MTTSRRPIRRIGALAAAVAVAALALSGCTPSAYELEQRTARSAYAAFLGRSAAGAAVDCSLELVSQGITGDRYDGTCTVRGTTFPIAALYDEPSPGRWTGFVLVQTPAGSTPRLHSCSFNKFGSEAWFRVSTCTTQAGSIP